MKIETNQNQQLTFSLGSYNVGQIQGIWSATYAHGSFAFDFLFDERIFKLYGAEIDWEPMKYVVNKVLSEIDSLDGKSQRLCKALYMEILGSIDTVKHPFELSRVEILGVQKVTSSGNAYRFLLEFGYFQQEDYNLTYSIKFSFDSFFSLESVRRGNGYQ